MNALPCFAFASMRNSAELVTNIAHRQVTLPRGSSSPTAVREAAAFPVAPYFGRGANADVVLLVVSVSAVKMTRILDVANSLGMSGVATFSPISSGINLYEGESRRWTGNG